MRSIVALIIALATLFAGPASAQAAGRVIVHEVTIVEEWDPAAGEWVEVTGAERLVKARSKPVAPAIAIYGPFRVTGPKSATLIGATDRGSPAQLANLLRDYPGIETLKLVDVAGTRNDISNMEVGRMIRDAELTTHVPAHGSVRSGGVELFLAGTRQRIDEGAEFAVHSWRDSLGMQASDYAIGHEVHRLYLDYYAEMGMSAADARAFYGMTNSAAYEDALWLDAQAMRRWVPAEEQAAETKLLREPLPRLDYAAFGGEIAASATLSMVDSPAALP